MRQCQQIRLTWKSLRFLFYFFKWSEKTMNLQHIWFYVIISISKDIGLTLKVLTFYQISLIEIYISTSIESPVECERNNKFVDPSFDLVFAYKIMTISIHLTQTRLDLRSV